jgi:hypothetical protein
MKYIPLIRANFLTELVNYLEMQGAPVETLLAQTKLPLSIRQNPEALFPLRQAFEFYDRAAQVEGSEILGFSVGQHTRIEDLGAFGRILSSSLTLHEAIQTAIHMIPTYNSGDRLWLTEEGNQIWLCRKFMDSLDPGWQHVAQCSVMLMIHLVQLAADPQWKPTEIYMETSAIQELENVEALAETIIHFEQHSTAIKLSRSLLSLPLRGSELCKQQQLCRDYRILHTSAPANSFPGSVRQVIKFLPPQGH